MGGGAAARKLVQAGVRGSHCAGPGAGAAHGPSGVAGRIRAVIFLRPAGSFFSGLPRPGAPPRAIKMPARLPLGVHWVVRGLCARALRLRGCLRCGAGVDRR